MEGLIQLQTEQVLLTYLLALSAEETSNFAARGAAQHTLAQLKVFIEEQKKTAKDDNYMAHLVLALERMKSPEKAKPTMQHVAMPPGAPIGCDLEDEQ